MYTLYGRAGSGSAVVEVLLEEIGADYRVESVGKGPEAPRGYAEINPLGQVPALILPDGTIMTESAAITIYLADKFPELGLAPPPDSPKRPIYLRWLVYLATSIYISDLRIYYCERYSTDPGHASGIREAAVARMAHEWDVYAAELGDRPFILGEEMSGVDIYAAMLATWNVDVPAFFRKHPNIKRMYDRVRTRPSVARVWTRHGIETWEPQAATA
ncbi:MAG: glutathione S-transferase family protein [Hyphomicrobiales bacterium]